MPFGDTLRVISFRTKRADKAGGVADLVRRQLADPLARNAYSLVGSNLASAGLGVVFWFAAARTYSVADVGIDTALISAMSLLAAIAMLNLVTAFNRFVPTAGTRTARFVGVGYLVSTVLAIMVAVIFVVGVQSGLWATQLSIVLGHTGDQLWFVLATVIWAIFTMQDAVLAGLGEAPWVLVENVSYGVVKLVVLLAVADHLPRTGVFVAWTAPLTFFVAAISLLLFGRLFPKRRHPPKETIDARVVGRFISADYPASLLLATAVLIMPLLALSITGDPKASAYVYLGWTFAYTLHLVSTNVGMSMITEAAHAPERLVEYARKTIIHSLRIVLPLAAVLVVSVPFVLHLLKPAYASHATSLTQLFVLAAIPTVFVNTYLNIMRVERRMATVLRVTAVQTLFIVVPAVVLLNVYGVVGIGIAWLGGQSVLALALLVGPMRTLWIPYLPLTSMRQMADSPAVKLLKPRSRSAQVFAHKTFEASGLPAQGWRTGDFVSHVHDIAILEVALPRWKQRGLLKVATSELGMESLHRELSALQTVRDASPPEINLILPRVVEAAPTIDGTWLLETVCDGVDAQGVVSTPTAIGPLLTDLTRRLNSLYRVTSGPQVVNDEVFARLVDVPIVTTDTVRTKHMGAIADERNLARLREELHHELAGRRLTMSLIHGDLWLGNVLWDPERREVQGIVDWHCSTIAFPSVDIMHLICTTRSLFERRELGNVVRDILDAGRLRPAEADLLNSVPGANEIPLRTLVLLTWLRHVFDNATLSKRRVARDFWLTQNVYAVLENLDPAYDPAVETGR